MRKATTNKIESEERVKKLIDSPLTPHDLKENKNEEEKIYHRTNLQLLCQNYSFQNENHKILHK